MSGFLAVVGRSTWRTFEYWSEVDGSLLAAAVSFYGCLSVFPLLMILLAGFGFFLQYTGYTQDLEQQILQYLSHQTSEVVAEQIHELMAQIETSAIITGPVGLLFLLMTALTLFVNFEIAFARIWKTKDKNESVINTVRSAFIYRLRAFAMLLGIGALVLLNFCSHFAIDVVAGYIGDFRYSQNWWRVVQLCSSVMLNALLFSSLYQTLPKVRVPWWFALRGGLLAAMTWEIGRYVLALFVISDKYHAFGVVGVFMGLLMWMFYAACVVLLGAAHTKVAMEEAAEASNLNSNLTNNITNTSTKANATDSDADDPSDLIPFRRSIPLNTPPQSQPHSAANRPAHDSKGVPKHQRPPRRSAAA